MTATNPKPQRYAFTFPVTLHWRPQSNPLLITVNATSLVEAIKRLKLAIAAIDGDGASYPSCPDRVQEIDDV